MVNPARRIPPYKALSDPAVAMGLDQWAALRALRLWHWQQCLKSRAFARRATTGAASSAAMYDAEADQHLKFVQTLNDYFPAGDTAERDAADV